jgi:hypothetical protein
MTPKLVKFLFLFYFKWAQKLVRPWAQNVKYGHNIFYFIFEAHEIMIVENHEWSFLLNW